MLALAAAPFALKFLTVFFMIHNAALRAGDRAADDDHVELFVDLDDVEVLDRDLLNAHLACADDGP